MTSDQPDPLPENVTAFPGRVSPDQQDISQNGPKNGPKNEPKNGLENGARGEDTPFQAIWLPDCPILIVNPTHGICQTMEGEIIEESPANLRPYYTGEVLPMLCHSPTVAKRLGMEGPRRCYDLLELFAFVFPARHCLPTVAGFLEACDIPVPQSLASYPMALYRAAEFLLEEFSYIGNHPEIRRLLWSMTRDGWLWGMHLLAAIGEDIENDTDSRVVNAGLDIWKSLPEWEELPPPPPPGTEIVTPQETRTRLAALLGRAAEDRPQQADFASAISESFTNPESDDMPKFVMAEAGTGVGKTMGYIAPASLWAEKNQAPVWLSTYTRNLQHQIDDELDRVFPDRHEKFDRVVLRKGRENYLCLLNYEDVVRGASLPGRALGLGLMARWIGATRDGDMSGGDFPSWLPDLIGRGLSTGLSDKRGECIHSACGHYSRCFVMNTIRRARYADLVIANHALVMVQAAQGMMDKDGRNSRVVFDEGHHVFDAADDAFSAYLTGREMWETRRWLRGNENRGTKSRIRGLKSRCEDLLGEEQAAHEALDRILRAASHLPNEAWPTNLGNGQPKGLAEEFLYGLHELVLARAKGREGPFSLEIPCDDIPEDILEKAGNLEAALQDLLYPVLKLREALQSRLDEKSDSLDSQLRGRIEQVCHSLEYRCSSQLKSWVEMLRALQESNQLPKDLFVDWFGIEKSGGRAVDVGYYRHWLDPAKPFAETISAHTNGVVITSATLTDGSGDNEQDWQRAEERTGAVHLPDAATRARVPSPFDYENQTRVIVVTDVRKDDMVQVAAAYRELMLASGGGALGLFTAISRLRAVYESIVTPLEEKGHPVYAQHVDALNLPTLIDIFRSEMNSCLLGTDAVRDGVDVPGESLRLIIFDRVPWSRPTILHKARKGAFGGTKYEDMLTRLKLKQAFGRLVRRGTDKGVFVLLDPMMPSRLKGAFPDGVEIERLGLADALTEIRRFYGTHLTPLDISQS